MKKWRMVSILLLALLLILILSVFVGCNKHKGSVSTEGLEYKLIDDGEGYAFAVVGLGTATDENIVIPSTYNGKPVVEIGDSAFKNRKQIKSIFMPNSILKIGEEAFSCCTSLTSITIPDSVTSIGGSAFFGCSGLISITIPNSVEYIGEGAFSGCESLVSITIPFVGHSMPNRFASSATLFGYIFGESSYTSGVAVEQAYADRAGTSSTYYIPSTLRSVTVTGGSILFGAFYNCSMLTSIIIDNGVTSINDFAFRGCSGLKSITFPNDVGVQIRGKGVFYGCSGLTSVTIPDCVTSIDDYTFYGCTDLISVLTSKNLRSIGRLAFGDCSGMISINISDNLRNIDDCAFYGCTNLTSVMFEGTKAQWDAISKGTSWDADTGNYTIYCTDGDIEK